MRSAIVENVTKSLLADAFEHHVWATLRVIDVCAPLTAEELETTVPGTYGSIIDTLRHTVGADSWYLFRTSHGRTTPLTDEEEAAMDLAAMRTVMAGHGEVWPTVLADDPDPDEEIVARRDDGAESYAPMGVRLAQAVHHGTDHRSQICTALTTLGIEPPGIDLWDWAQEHGRLRDVAPRS